MQARIKNPALSAVGVGLDVVRLEPTGSDGFDLSIEIVEEDRQHRVACAIGVLHDVDRALLGAAIIVGAIGLIVSLATASRVAFLVFAVCLGVAVGGSVRRWRLRRKSS